MAGTFDNAVSFVELPIGTITTGSTAFNAYPAARFAFPYDVEIVGASVTGLSGTATATTLINIIASTAVSTAASDMIWTTTGTTNAPTTAVVKIDQAIVTVVTQTAHGFVPGQSVTLSGIVADSVLSTSVVNALNGAQTVLSVDDNKSLAATTGCTLTFGPLKQAQLYDTTTGFWKFTTAKSTQASGKVVLTEQLVLVCGTTTAGVLLSTVSGYSPDKVKTITNPDGTTRTVSTAFIAAGTPIVPVAITVDSSYAGASIAAGTPTSVTLQIAVKKA